MDKREQAEHRQTADRVAGQGGKPLERDSSWWAANPEIVVVTTKKVACDGVGGALGHPKVFYDMAEDDFVECKYCDRVFVLKGGSHDPGR